MPENFHLFAWEVPIAGGMALLASVVTFLQVKQHITQYAVPRLQKPIIRIILMVPIYAICSLVSLIYKPAGVYIDLVRDAYEAFVLYQFMNLLVEYCGGERELVRVLHAKAGKGRHLFPFCCLRFDVNKPFLWTCKRGTLQYSIIKPLNALVALVASLGHAYIEGHWDWTHDAYPYVCVLNNVAITISMYYLVLFETTLHEELKVHQPMLKFLCIKFIIFLSFWQGVALSAAMKFNVVRGRDEVPAAEIGSAIQDFLICIEMAVVSALHLGAFGYRQMMAEVRQSKIRAVVSENTIAEYGASRGSALANLGDALSLQDILGDALRTLSRQKKGLLERALHLGGDGPGLGGEDADGGLGRSGSGAGGDGGDGGDGVVAVDTRTGLAVVAVPAEDRKHFPRYAEESDDAVLHAFERCRRMTHKGRRKDVVLLVTDTAVCVTTPRGEQKRFIAVAEITQLCVTPAGQLGVKTTQNYDLLLEFSPAARTADIVRILGTLYQYLTKGPLATAQFDVLPELTLDKPEVIIRSADDLNWSGRIDTRTGLRIAAIQEAEQKFFRDMSEETLYFLQHAKRFSSKGDRKACVFGLTDLALYVLQPDGTTKRRVVMESLTRVHCKVLEGGRFQATEIVATFTFAEGPPCVLQLKSLAHAEQVCAICEAWAKYFHPGFPLIVVPPAPAGGGGGGGGIPSPTAQATPVGSPLRSPLAPAE